jgi:hypothetical protein
LVDAAAPVDDDVERRADGRHHDIRQAVACEVGYVKERASQANRSAASNEPILGVKSKTPEVRDASGSRLEIAGRKPR